MANEATVHKFAKTPYIGEATSPDPSISRFGEPSKFVPVAFVLCVIVCLWSIYVFCHCLPLMANPHSSPEYVHGWTCLVVINLLTLMVLSCYWRSMMQHPGTIPDRVSPESGENAWDYVSQDRNVPALEANLQEQKERKRLGDRRNCKWCNKFKPDRCHHCRVCRMCILKMDHHCPWIYNCVGFKNFKYFFLLVFYTAATSNFMTWTMWDSVGSLANNPHTAFLWMFAVLFGEGLAGLLACLLTAFLAFHIHLMLKAMTTIEFCEKSRRPNFDTECYSRGIVGNIQAVLGDSPLLWLAPISPPSGNGMVYTSTDRSPLVPARDKEAKRYGTAILKRSKQSSSDVQVSAGTGELPDFGANVPPVFSGE